MSTKGTPAQPRIAVIGGGPAGLALLATLSFRGINATVYERDESVTSRAHLGGTLDLGWDSGQRALRENALQAQFDQNSRLEADEYRMYDKKGDLVLFRGSDYTKDRTKFRPEIDRKTLRQILLDAAPAGSIKWGHGLKSAQPLSGGQYQLTFVNGETTVCDILVGADGARSQVRPLLTPAVPIYHEVNGAEVSLAPDVAARADMADVRELVGKGSAMGADKHKMLFSQTSSTGRIRTYLWFEAPEDWVLPEDPDAARKLLLDVFADWDPRFLKLIEHCDNNAMYQRPLHHLPIDLEWERVPGVAIVGDAAHLLSPFGGSGANASMLDALELGLLLAESISKGQPAEEREAAIAAWEKTMWTRAHALAKGAKQAVDGCLHSENPFLMIKHAEDHLNGDVRNEAKAGQKDS